MALLKSNKLLELLSACISRSKSKREDKNAKEGNIKIEERMTSSLVISCKDEDYALTVRRSVTSGHILPDVGALLGRLKASIEALLRSLVSHCFVH